MEAKNNYLKSYIKITFFILVFFFLGDLLLIKFTDEAYDWYRLLNMEGVIVGGLLVSIINFFFIIYLPEKNIYDIINFIILFLLFTLFMFKKDFILSIPTKIDIEYISMKFGIIGVSLYIIPFLISKYEKNYTSFLKILSLFTIIYFFTNLFLNKFKISFIGFIITAIFLSLIFYLSNKKVKINK